MSDSFVVKSRIMDYEVNFVDSFTSSLSDTDLRKSFFIIDEGLLNLYKAKLDNILPEQQILTVEVSEQNKTLDYCQSVIKTLIQRRIRKNYTLVAIGGGIIQDVTAFISSILFRGIHWVFYPTTLLAQADSCIGSKTSINFGTYKNILGGFYPPSRIYIDVNFLKTLPTSEIRSGIGEILHFYFIAGSKMTEVLAEEFDDLLIARELLKDHILESLRIKKSVVERDEFDLNERNLFNYGHTFGHAIESVSGYKINHGQAVTMGMDIANHISLKLGYLNEINFECMHKILALNMPSFHLRDNMIEDYFEALSKDKKNIGKNLGCILSSGPGSMKKMQIPISDELKNIILNFFKNFA